MNRISKICFIVAVPGTAKAFLSNHIEALSSRHLIYLVANMLNNSEINIPGLTSITHVPIIRGISIYKDIRATYLLYKFLKKEKFSAVHSVTPKAGLLTAIAAYIARVPVRIHIFTGQVWATKTGFIRRLLMLMDKIIVRLNTDILVDGISQRNFLIEKGILRKNQATVLGSGSISGVDLIKFFPKPEVRDEIRTQLGIQSDTVVFSFMGRFNTDKGINELFSAFNSLCEINTNAFLLLIGVDEEGMLSSLKNYAHIEPGKNFHFYGHTNSPESVLQSSDVFCFPSYREGFGTSVLEASALGIPVICSDTYGVLDAMVDNVTGLRCKTKDVASLFECMKRLAEDNSLRKKLGNNGRSRIIEEFSAERITNEWVKLYSNFVKE